jgi:hypothetical protein
MQLGLLYHLAIGVDVLQADAVSAPEKAQTPRHVLVRNDRQDRDPGRARAIRFVVVPVEVYATMPGAWIA